MVESMGTSLRYKISSTRNQTKPHPYPTHLISKSMLYIWNTTHPNPNQTKPNHQQLIKLKMLQASIYLPSSSPLLSVNSSPSFSKTTLLLFPTTMKNHQSAVHISSTSVSVKASASEAPEVDYSSMASSVFPAEACETVGGVACDVDMFPETKLREEAKPKAKESTTKTSVDREYLEYNSPKTVFISEACDDLGGEFCDPDYQTGVVNN